VTRWRWLALAAAAVALVVLLGGAGLSVALRRPCVTPAPSELSLAGMADVKRRVDQHSRDPSVPLVLDGEGATFLLADYLEFPVRIDVQGGLVSARLAVPVGQTCFAVGYDGGVEVDEHGALLTPERLVVGDLDLSAVARLRQWRAGPDDMWRPAAAELLAAIRYLRVEGDEVVLRIDDPWSLR
jgi:hypothetical protein